MSFGYSQTLQDFQDTIEILTNNDRDTPATTDDEWTIRLALIYQAIGNWESEDVFWDELWKTYTHGATVTGATYVLSFTDFSFAGSTIRLTLSGATTHIPLVSPEEVQNFQAGTRVAYITGSNHAGWTLNFNWTPTSGDGTYGATIVFDYYKNAFLPSATTDTVEMRDTQYITYWVAGQKALLEGKNNQFSVYDGLATKSLDTMRVMNEIGPANSDNTTDDLDAINHGAVLGE